MWSTRPLPELGAQLRRSLERIGNALDASAYAFGEECRSDVGEPTFLIMETDFRVMIAVDSLENEEAMGNEVSTAMRAIDALPADQIPGPRPGRVEFEFRAPRGQSLRLIVDIARYRQEAANMDGAALFNYFRASP